LGVVVVVVVVDHPKAQETGDSQDYPKDIPYYKA